MRLWKALLAGWMGVLLLPTGMLQAQDLPEVKAIRQAYNELGAGIAICPGAEEPCGYYLNTLHVNRHGGPWAAVGIYDSQQNFWYRFPDEEEAKPELCKVVVETHRSDRLEYEEFFFGPDKALRFYYFKEVVDGAVTQEHRFYVQGGKLVTYVDKVLPDVEAYRRYGKGDLPDILGDASRLVGLFEASFN